MIDLYPYDDTDFGAAISVATPFAKFDTAVNFVYDHSATMIHRRKMYRVLENFRYYVGERGDNVWVYVPKGFLTELASVPKWIEWLLPHDGPYAKAAIVHDILCEQGTMFVNGEPTYVSLDTAHKIFDEAMAVLGVNRIVRTIMVSAVRLHFWLKKLKKRLFT